MISTAEAAKRLGVTPARVRALLEAGRLRGGTIGRTWVVDEASVGARVREGARAGRPRRGREAPRDTAAPDADALHRLFDGCREQLAGSFDAATVRAARTPEEARFYMAVSSFFLQERQRTLIEEGVF